MRHVIAVGALALVVAMTALPRPVAAQTSNADIATLAKGKKPGPGTATVELLKGNDYLRVWINRGGNNYLIHLRPAA